MDGMSNDDCVRVDCYGSMSLLMGLLFAGKPVGIGCAMKNAGVGVGIPDTGRVKLVFEKDKKLHDYHIKNANLIQRLDGVPDEQRTARFVCAIAAAFPDGRVETVRGTMEGRIGYEEKGANGFGYDPIFFLPEYGCTSAELSMEEKNKISHRGKALQAIKEELR